MNILILGAAGFIGTNLTLQLSLNKKDLITVVDQEISYFHNISSFHRNNIIIKTSSLLENTDFDSLLEGQDIVYHLVSTTMPTNSKQHIPQEFLSNVIMTMNMLEACIRCNIKKVVFLSSGGTVYGKDAVCPLKEDTVTMPITSYGLQKINIEQALYLYNYMYGLDYRIIRLSNPYGPYQRPNGQLGAVTTFIYKALHGDNVIVYGDGSVVRDFIYIDDAVKAIIKIANGNSTYKLFNVGSGHGTPINEVLSLIESTLNLPLNIIYKSGRKVDVPINYLDISRYESIYGALNSLPLSEGILRTAEFIQKNM